MTIPGSGSALLLRRPAAGGYQISRSLRFNSSDSAYLSRTPASAGNRKTWTWAGWVKRSTLGAGGYIFSAGTSDTSGDHFLIRFDAADTLLAGRGQAADRRTVQVFRDASAWGHIVVAVDTTQATGSNRIRVYFNGTEITTFQSPTDPSLNQDLGVNATSAHAIGRDTVGSSSYFNGYLADIYFIDGQALDPTSFGEFDATTGVWVPKAFTGSYGTNGFQLKFEDNSSNTATTLGKDTSGNGNNWTPNNLSVTAGAGNDSLVDVPTNGAQTDTGVGGEVRGNYCTLNPLDTKLIQSNGNLDATASTSQTWVSGRGTFGVMSGKWYWEITLNSVSTTSDNVAQIGIHALTSALPANDAAPNADAYVYVNYSGEVYNNGSGSSYGATWTTGDVIGVAYDADNGTLAFYKNGSSQGTAYSGLSASKIFAPIVTLGRSSTSTSVSVNFGQRPFAYTAPSGFKTLCTANLPAPLVTKPSTVMDIVTRSGFGTSGGTVSSLNFEADLIWSKCRNQTSTGHFLLDSVRGITKTLSSNGTNSEATYSTWFTSITATGYTLGAGDWTTSQTVVEWCWDAGSSTVTNTQGSITSSVRANPSAGFSIVTYTGNATQGASVGHGLGVAPSMLIVKNRSSSTSWAVGHSGLGGWNKVLYLNLTDSVYTQSEPFNGTTPTSTVFQLWDSSSTNSNGANYVAYCFAPVAGYSSFGSYTGNGSTDGPFVYTGFRPRFLLLKSAGVGDWIMIDTERNVYNLSGYSVIANDPVQENYYGRLDFLSNGFKLRSTFTSTNPSGTNVLFAAFAESPFNYSRAR